MRGLGIRIQAGLKEWVGDGTCPPEVSRRIEAGLRALTRKPWWRSWQASAGAVAAVAAVFMLAVGTRPEFASQVAGFPLLGVVAAQFATPDLNVRVMAPPTDSLVQAKSVRTLSPGLSAAKDGIVLTVRKVETGDTYTRIQYDVTGALLDKSVATSAYQPVLTGPAGPVSLLGYSATQRKDSIAFHADFGPVVAGQWLTFGMNAIPMARPEAIRWTVNQDGVLAGPGTPDVLGAELVAFIRQGSKVLATVQWPEDKVLHVTGWVATDSGGKRYVVRESGRPALANHVWIEHVTIEVPPGVPLTLMANEVVQQVAGPWQVRFTN